MVHIVEKLVKWYRSVALEQLILMVQLRVTTGNLAMAPRAVNQTLTTFTHLLVRYTVTLEVTDNSGATSSNNTTVTVTDVAAPTNELTNGVALYIAGSQDSETTYSMDVPVNATNLNFATNGGSGDADIYVKFGSAPTKSDYDCRPYMGGNNESCSIEQAQAGTYYVMVYGYNTYDTVLTGSFDVTANTDLSDACAVQGPVTGGELTAGEVTCLGSADPIWLSVSDVNNHSSIAITTANGSGDIAIEFSNYGWPNGTNLHGSSNNAGNNECVYITNLSQYWGYLKISGGGEGTSIVVDFDTNGCR